MKYTAEQYLDRIENKRLNSTPLYTREEMIDFAEKYAKQLLIQCVVSSFVYVIKDKDREEPLGIYKTYQKAYRGKASLAKINWTNTHIEKWKLS